jgi:hypothetical protein
MKPTFAMQPFFSALQDIIRHGEPQRKQPCRGCGGGGELPGGGACMWCSEGDPQCNDLPGKLEDY